MNEATVKITGVKREELIGSDFFDYFTQQIWHEKFGKFFQWLCNPPLTLCHKDGKLTDVLFNGSVYKMMKESIRNCNGARDVTKQKQAALYTLYLRQVWILLLLSMRKGKSLTKS
jgi:hypothetical protein